MSELIELEDLKATKDFGLKFAEDLLADKEKNITLLFYGEMGAGKTTMIRELGAALGIEQNITSPTFVGLNHYTNSKLEFLHFDLYQVMPEAESLSELFDNANKKIFAIEWAEKLNQGLLDLIEANAKILEIKIQVQEDESRKVGICSK